MGKVPCMTLMMCQKTRKSLVFTKQRKQCQISLKSLGCLIYSTMLYTQISDSIFKLARIGFFAISQEPIKLQTKRKQFSNWLSILQLQLVHIHAIKRLSSLPKSCPKLKSLRKYRISWMRFLKNDLPAKFTLAQLYILYINLTNFHKDILKTC